MTGRIAIGQLVDGQFGIDISKPGIDVLGAGVTIFDFMFSSRYSQSAIVHATGTLNRGDTAYFPDLGYVPMAHCCIVTGSTVEYERYYDPPSDGNYKVGYTLEVTQEPVWEVTSSSLRIVPLAGYDGSPYACRYIVFKLAGGP